MSSKEIKRLELMERYKAGGITQEAVGLLLGLGTRQVKRLWQKYKKDGPKALVSKKRGKRSHHQIKAGIKEVAIDVIKTHYSDFGPTFSQEKLAEKHGIILSIETVRQMMMKEGLWISKKSKRTVRVHQQRLRRACFGELVQMDGSPHDWFEGRAPECTLLVLVDDATSAILNLRFEMAETTHGYFSLIEGHLKRYGRPVAYYTDQHSIFKVNMVEANRGTGDTQLGRALKELDIELITANSPQAKGRVERANKTLQDRLIKEMRLRGISSINEANAFLPEFIEDYNNRFAKPPQSDSNAHRSLDPDHGALEHILSLQSFRTLSKNLECSYHNRIYQIQSQDFKHRLINKKILICERQDGTVFLFYKHKLLHYQIFDKLNQPTKTLDRKLLNHHLNKKDLSIPRKKAIPTKHHPWKKFFNLSNTHPINSTA